ncbi:MAG TPA: small multi-drug export protein [Candidatus Acidoferrum sp.]|nr:small multi-drug export protein [Candidatus Acidoferrum sp.]
MNLLTRLGNDLYVLGLAATPIVELRGSVPLAAALGLSWEEAFTLSFIGNMLPVPLVIWLGRALIRWLKGTRAFGPTGQRLERRFLARREVVVRYSVIGLAILVAVPLPGTGAYTGAFLASLLDLRMRYALPAIALGVFVADILVTALTYGLIM